jgi:lipid-A-disaccharide synthase
MSGANHSSEGRASARPSEEMILYFVAGEASGDEHGAALLRALREAEPNVQFLGRGGPQMKAIAGGRITDWIDEAGVVGLWEVIKHYGYFRTQFRRALNEIAAATPDAIVLIDYPGFNLRLARALRKRSPAQKIIYYISPQVWAWNSGRISAMARTLDLMLCIFPFEADLYNQSGLRTIFVGHPMIKSLGRRQIDSTRNPNLIGLFPGSRFREVRKIFPLMIAVMRNILQERPASRFEVAAASEALAAEIQQLLLQFAFSREKVRVGVGETAAIMQRAFAGIVASGTATLEAAYFRLPFVLVYKVSWITYLAARLLVRVKYLGMPNVLAGQEIVPEFIQHRAKPPAIAGSVLHLMDDLPARQRMISQFDRIIHQLGQGEANEQAARAILGEINNSLGKALV